MLPPAKRGKERAEAESTSAAVIEAAGDFNALCCARPKSGIASHGGLQGPPE